MKKTTARAKLEFGPPTARTHQQLLSEARTYERQKFHRRVSSSFAEHSANLNYELKWRGWVAVSVNTERDSDVSYVKVQFGFGEVGADKGKKGVINCAVRKSDVATHAADKVFEKIRAWFGLAE